MKTELLNQIIYQVYTRNFSEEGSFKEVGKALPYFKKLGVDILYLLPVSPIGKLNRKGDLGSPYSIEDYMKINPELGTEDDFKSLVENAHGEGMKVMIDIVFNHTSRDSYLVKHHPEWMYKNKEGKMSNKVGDWSDVYDLEYDAPGLVDYLVSVIEHYCALGVDGFRFDVASLLPKKFFLALRKMLDEKYPETILLGESVEPSFITYLRSNNITALSDSELYDCGFDLLYMYDCFPYLRDYLEGKGDENLTRYKLALYLETTANPKEGMRIRGLENHDQKRLLQFTNDRTCLLSLLSYPIFMKGPMFIYDGLETDSDHVLSLFTKDVMTWGDPDKVIPGWKEHLQKLISFKKEEKNKHILTSVPSLKEGKYLLIKNTYDDGDIAFGYFPLAPGLKVTDEELIDDEYTDYLSKERIKVEHHLLQSDVPLLLFKKL